MCHSFCRNENVGFSGHNNLEIKCWTCDCRKAVICFLNHKISFPFLIHYASPLESHITYPACHHIESCQWVCGSLNKLCQVETAFISLSPTWPQSPGKKKKTVLCVMWLEASKSVLAIFYYLGPSNFLLAIVEKVAFARFTHIWCPETLSEGILSNHFQLCDSLGPDFWSPVILRTMTAFYFPACLSHPTCWNIIFVAHRFPNLTKWWM